jgi:polysaccharide pyruvyl transferase WcaK-like protein
MRFCLTGGWFDSPNIGDNALLLGIVESLGTAAPAEFTVLTPDPARVRTVHGLPALAPRRQPLKLIRLLCSVDALVFTGGSPFFDHTAQMLYCAALAMIARLCGAKVIVWGIWLRPLSNRQCRALVRFICRRADYLSGRDPETVRGLSELASGEVPVEFLPDPATQMTPISRDQAQELLAGEGVRPNEKAIAICMRNFQAGREFGVHHYDRQFSPGDVERYQDALAELVRSLLEKTDCRILFLPMHTVEPDDDRVPAVRVVERLGASVDRTRVSVVRHQYQPREMRGMLGLMELVVGMRFHSLLLASAMGVPVVSISYASKSESIMDLIGQRQHMIRIADVTGTWLCRHALEVLSQHDALQSTLRKQYAAFAAVYETQLSRLMVLLGGVGGTSSPGKAQPLAPAGT